MKGDRSGEMGEGVREKQVTGLTWIFYYNLGRS